MRTWLWLFFLILPFAARAQGTVTLQVSGGDAGVINASQCGDTQSVTYTVSTASTAPACSAFTIWITTGTCGNTIGTGDVQIASIPQSKFTVTPTGSVTFTGNDLPGLTSGCGSAIEQDYTLCGVFSSQPQLSGCTGFSVTSINPTFRYDAIPPLVPSLTDIVSLDQGLNVKFTVNSTDTTLVGARYRVSDAGTDWSAVSTTASTSSIEIDNLVNDTRYDVELNAQDFAANVSDFSDAGMGTPLALTGFWTNYKNAGGSQTGGCSSFGGPLWLLAAAPALYSLVRRRR